MINELILEAFRSLVPSGNILESGLSAKQVADLRKTYKVASFDMDTSRFTFVPTGFRANSLVRVPYDNEIFDGVILKNAFDKFGDKSYFFSEILRVQKGGPIIMMEGVFDAFPRDYLIDSEDITILKVAVNGSVRDVDVTATEFYLRKDIRKIMSKPGSSLNKYNMLVPEDVKAELTILCQQSLK